MSDNKYLEKVATSALKKHLTAKGVDTAGVSSSQLNAGLTQGKGSFAKVNATANKIGTKMPSAPNFVQKAKRSLTGDSLAGLRGKPLSEGAASKLSAIKSNPTTSLGKQLQSNVAAKANGAASAGKGILGKAMGLAKKHPLAAGALAAGAVGSVALASRKKEPGYYQ